MILIKVSGGAVVIITNKQLNTWQYMYKNINVEHDIKEMDRTGIFKKMTGNGCFKFINKALEINNNQ